MNLPPKTPIGETVSLHYAKTNLSELVERAAAGEEIVIAKFGKPKARLVSPGSARPLREPGQGRGKWRLTGEFDAPLPDEVIARFAPKKPSTSRE